MILFKNKDICVFQSALFCTTATVIQTADLVLVVDPNWLPQEVYAIQNFVREIRKGRDLYLLFTHSDYDHIIGYQAFPDAKVIASKAFVENPDKEAIIKQIKEWDEGFYIVRNYPISYPAVDIVVEKDAQQLSIGATNFTFYLAPGHNRDGIFTFVEWESKGVLFLGDYLSDVEFPFIYHSSEDYEKTLDKAAQLAQQPKFQIAIPGHGSLIHSNAEMAHRIKESRAYIQELRQSIQNKQDYPTELLWQRYAFRKGMEHYHQGNVKLIAAALHKAI